MHEEHQERISHIWQQYIAKQAVHQLAEWQWKNGRWVSTTVIRVNRDNAPVGGVFVGCANARPT